MRGTAVSLGLGAVVGLCALGLVASCGARTGLVAPEPEDAATDKPVHHDAQPDVFVEEDALPLIDTFLPDVPVFTDCPDAGSTLVYLITEEDELLSFYPPTLSFKTIGKIACPSQGATPFSMGVDRLGTAYSSFTNGGLFKISTANAACQATSYAPDQQGFHTFCMGYAGQPDGGDTLYVAECSGPNTDSLGLGSIDTSAFKLSFIGGFQPPMPSCELTGTGDGRLFGFCINPSGGSTIVQIDPSNAHIIAANPLQVGDPFDGFAFAFWGGVFWIFTTPGGTSTVTRYDPQDQSEKTMTTYPGSIVGAGVSTCAPE